MSRLCDTVLLYNQKSLQERSIFYNTCLAMLIDTSAKQGTKTKVLR